MKNQVASFQMNHEKLLRGVYVSRVDVKDGVTVTTFDIRMKEPNREMVLDTSVMHTLEHLLAVYLRDSSIKEDVLYIGPMGCRTGMYILLFGQWSPADFAPHLQKAFEFIVNYKDVVPATQPIECGNCLDHNLGITRIESKIFLNEVLNKLDDAHTIYPE